MSSLGLPLYSVTPPSPGMLVGAPRLVRAGGRGPGEEFWGAGTAECVEQVAEGVSDHKVQQCEGQ